MQTETVQASLRSPHSRGLGVSCLDNFLKTPLPGWTRQPREVAEEVTESPKGEVTCPQSEVGFEPKEQDAGG